MLPLSHFHITIESSHVRSGDIAGLLRIFFFHGLDHILEILKVLLHFELIHNQKLVKVSANVLMNGFEDGYVDRIAGHFGKIKVDVLIRGEKIGNCFSTQHHTLAGFI